ncbi:hypothetical protein E4T52_07477 [Aureobasidium sp. EXF-3400]|nr:hypothetical protein E4T51_06395 [Aureobasidium sp. EXF-12344]KAI4777617.1 hypothetical protein E4T52_07477 [Aureobasidium sp. EXF-3400]
MSASLAPECNEVKERYDSCFLKWYSESKSPAFLIYLFLLLYSSIHSILFLAMLPPQLSLSLGLERPKDLRSSLLEPTSKEGKSNGRLTIVLTEYLRGTATSDECEPLFAKYKQCLSRALKERGIDKMLDEARADNRENDLENMKPGSG